ncbi:MAG: ATP-binding protein [Bacillota bacterium]|nr:ATP-binding protein [Bacillota bacterium]
MAEINENKPNLYILVGIPCSGKSYYSEKFFKPRSIKVVSTDEIRIEITGTRRFNLQMNNEIFDLSFSRLKEELISGRDVAFDATNTNKKYRKNVIKLGKSCNSRIIAIVMKTPLDVCIKRNRERTKESRLPEEKLYYFSKSNLDLDYSEGFDEIIEVKYTEVI